MGLDEPDIDLGELIQDSGSSTGGGGRDISDMSKKEVAKQVIQREGQINLGENKALIKCPCKKTDLFGDHITQYMCMIAMRPDPVDGKKKPVCSGPLLGINMRTDSSKIKEWRSGTSVRSGCPYSPYRFGQDDDDL